MLCWRQPENLLVDQKGTLKLADFGLACEKKGAYIQVGSRDAQGFLLVVLRGCVCVALRRLLAL
jgi:serine/threonine protein kinase